MDQLFCLQNVRELRLSRESNHLMSLLTRQIQKRTTLKLKVKQKTTTAPWFYCLPTSRTD